MDLEPSYQSQRMAKNPRINTRANSSEIGKETRRMDLVSFSGAMGHCMLEIGKKTKEKVPEQEFGPMGTNTLEST